MATRTRIIRRVGSHDGCCDGSDDHKNCGGACSNSSSSSKPYNKEKKTFKFNAQGFVTQQVGKLLQEYAIGDMLGSGGFGEVYLGTHKTTGTERAIKVINKSPTDDNVNKAVLHEFNVVRKLDHPNILKMYNLYQDRSHFYIVTDIYKGGELFDEIIKRTKFTETDAADLMNNFELCQLLSQTRSRSQGPQTRKYPSRGKYGNG